MSAKSFTDIVVIAGPSGSGKGTVISCLPDNFKKAVSATTRGIRPGEKEDIDYFYITKEAFEDLIKNNGLVEWNQYGSDFYGTPSKQIDDIRAAGNVAILDIDVNGARNIKKMFPEATLIFLILPSAIEQRERLRHRNSDSEEKIAQRIETTRKELTEIGMFDRVYINYSGKVKETAKAILDYLSGEESPSADINELVEHYFDGYVSAV